MHLSRVSTIQALMDPLLVTEIELEACPQTGFQTSHPPELHQIDAIDVFVLHGTRNRKLLHENVVQRSSPAIHIIPYTCTLQGTGERLRGNSEP